MSLHTTLPVRFALIGFGHIGRRHAAIIMANPSAELVAVIDIQETVRMHPEFPDKVPFFTSVHDFIHAGISTHVVVLALPNGLHTSMALTCINAGMHVIIEKPMGLDVPSCEAVLQAATNHDKKVFVVKQNRYSPQVKWLKEVVSSGVLGKIVLLQVNCFWNRDRRYYEQPGNTWRGTADLDGGVLFTQFSHFIDIMYWIFGDIDVLSATMDNKTHEGITAFADTGVVTFSLQNGGLGVLQFTTSVWDRNLESAITIIGEHGTVKLGGQYMDTVNYCHIQGYKMPDLPPANPPNNYGTYQGSAANHYYVIENVIQTLHGEETVATSGEDGLAVVRIICHMMAAAGKQPSA
jgi:UDP-N-acetyl-2-amino-2-deoxyglucuronate dehydrogenase